ncbi:threonine synthase [Bailinhaonella thermotolerans]|uniref:Pyridoxal-phosphate dependent enzyme n=1 Tax=Bailinhaonella thermotolerans TaxID=1070861 RepID=A0A3A4A1Z5_9ACTN|nr:pyridoxal-phosphate dependent enzyme [Bailinhaonella thermotolerans]RJL22591.1 pyridoxal-phosphate dependent enzyme [Bailinhaonella thermotolerans]
MTGDSLAVGQRSLGDPEVRYPLWPPALGGDPATSTEDVAYPVEVDYDYGRVPADLFGRDAPGRVDRWAALLPPLTTPGLGEGGTPLVEVEDAVFVKDESRNPTWSHKDRLNRCTVSAAVGVGARGVVVASSGNHGASAAAYSARAGLPCVVLTSAAVPPAVASFLAAYGAVVLPVPVEARWGLTRRIVEEYGFHPVSNLGVTHTGHPFGPEGYKTVAYEIHADLGVPEAVFVPTGYGELLFGVWKGFAELRRLGVTTEVPRLFSCEPAAGGPLHRAVSRGLPATWIEPGDTDAYSIGCPVNGYRGVHALRESRGEPLLVTDEEMRRAQTALAGRGLWAELSSAAAYAGYRQVRDSGRSFDGPVVCVSTSSGFKDIAVAAHRPQPVDPAWPEVQAHLAKAGITP